MRRFSTLAVSLVLALAALPVLAQEKWKGIDEAVIEKFAQERGRQAQPFLELEGDLLLFLFALAGAVGGFVMGYFWHKIFVAGKKDQETRN